MTDGLPKKGRIPLAGGSAIRNKDGSLRVNVGDVVRLSKDTPHPDGSLPKLFGPMTGVVVKVYPDVGSGSGKKKTGKVKVRWASGSEATHDGHLVYTVESIKARGLEGLPTRGRIPLPTAKRALNRLGRKAKACGITPALLREGMEIEREHRDITKGRVLDTAKIAAAHLCERPDYYRRIKRYVER